MVVRYRYRQPPVQPEFVDGVQGASLSLAKLQKPPEEDPYSDYLSSTWEEPAFLPSQTQVQRTVVIIRSNEEEYRSQHYPTIHERIVQQRVWAQRQLQETKIAAKRAAIKRSMESRIDSTLKAAQNATAESYDQFEKELNDLLQESEDTILANSGENSRVNLIIAQQLMDLKERKVMATKSVSAAQYHRHFTLWKRRKRAIAFKLGLVRTKENDASIVLPWLLIGNRELACDMAKLQKLNVTHILNMTHDCPNMFPDSFVYEKVPVRDSLETDLTPYWSTIVNFIKRVESCKGRVSSPRTICPFMHLLSYSCGIDSCSLYRRSIKSSLSSIGIFTLGETHGLGRCL